jgi:hypothetical protein
VVAREVQEEVGVQQRLLPGPVDSDATWLT